uniref:F-box protein n=1 Tax=Kalanchoe fedtschenkoi TaxID=63787 RepID=A0A7N1A1L7_KALFE
MAAEADSMSASLSSDLFYDILRRLDGLTLASAACVSSFFSSLTKEEKIWEEVCSSLWPSTNREDIKQLISSLGGFRKFYADCFPLIVNNDVPDYQWKDYVEYSEEWTDADYYGDVDENDRVSPSDFVSVVDIRYKDKHIYSGVLSGIPNANSSTGWFYDCPFRIDFLNHAAGDDNVEDGVTISVSDGLPSISSIEKERKDGNLWRELRGGIRLSWIVVNKKLKQAANLASWVPLYGHRHWPTETDFVLRFGSVLSAKDILPCQVAECILFMKLRLVSAEDDGPLTTLKLTELSMQLEDMEGSCVNGRNSLLILKESLSCRRSKNYNEFLKSCHLYAKVQNELKEEKMRNESRLDRLCIVSGILAFSIFWYYVI